MLPPILPEAGKIIDGLARAVDRFITTPEEKQAIRQALENEWHRHQESLKKITLEDVQGARTREAALGNSLGVWVQNAAAVLVLLLFGGLLLLLWSRPIAPENQRLADLLMGSLSGVVLQLFNYWFGASARERARA